MGSAVHVLPNSNKNPAGVKMRSEAPLRTLPAVQMQAPSPSRIQSHYPE